MITKHAVYLNGVSLHGLDESIITQGVQERVPQMNFSTVQRGDGSGLWAGEPKRQELDVVVRFSIMEKRDLTRRSEIMDKILQWAHRGGWLSVRYRPGRRLRVVLAQAPQPGDLRLWNGTMSMTFRAYEVPYWQEEQETVRNGAQAASSTTIEFFSRGTAPAPLEANVTAGGAVDVVAITCNGQKMRLEDLGMSSGDVLRIRHTDNGVLQIVVASGETERSVYACRTTDSADEVWLNPGMNSIVCEAGASCSWTIKTRGRWL